MPPNTIQFCILFPIFAGLQALLIITRRDVIEAHANLRLENIAVPAWILVMLYLCEGLSATAITLLLPIIARGK